MGDALHVDVAHAAGRVPAEVVAVVRTLSEAGHVAFLVGRCVRELLAGAEVRDFEVATSAGPETVLDRFPMAVPTSPGGRTVTLRAAAAAVDITRFRCADRIEEELRHRDFSIHGMALDPLGRVLIDPHGGLRDIASGSLRAVGNAKARLAEDPLRALRAARLVAELGLSPDAQLEAAMADGAASLASVARVRIREELKALLLAPGAADGLALLRRTGVEAQLTPGTRPDAGAVLAHLPADVDLRLAAWLRGTRAVSILRRLRYPRSRVQRIERILRLHPVDGQVSATVDIRMRRLLRRAGPELRSLLALREAEIAAWGAPPAEVARLAAFREAIERILRAKRAARQSAQLALDGRAVMEHLGCPPGPRVGQALRHLARAVEESPECNTPDRLRALLDSWAGPPGAGGRGLA
jgi:tRNA nucleotidyltransferase/poly(A) polymerase